MNELITTLLFLFAVIDPLGSVPVYLEATKKLDKADKRKVAVRGPLMAFLILFIFIVGGQIVLDGRHSLWSVKSWG